MNINVQPCDGCKLGLIWQEMTDQLVPQIEVVDTKPDELLTTYDKLKEADQQETVDPVERARRDQINAYADEATFSLAAESMSIVSRIAAAFESVKDLNCEDESLASPTTQCPRLARLMPILLAIGEEANVVSNHWSEKPRPE